MSARNDTLALMARLQARGIQADFAAAQTFRRAQKTLHRWAELECGDGDNYKSWAIERDEKTEKPYMVIYPHTGESRRYRIADRETGALKRVVAECHRIGAFYYHQTDPRGCALYVGAQPLNGDYSSHGVACCE